MRTIRLLVAICAAGACLMGQSFTASLTGTVADSTGGVIPQATVVAVNTATNARTTSHSDAAGNFTILQLAPGPYMVEVSASGFKKLVRGPVGLEVQQQARSRRFSR
jgi:hypothetical protein